MPNNFVFQLTAEEAEASRFQIGILEKGLHFNCLPYAFTQEGFHIKESTTPYRVTPRHKNG